jgi:hypothetical protein
LHSHRIDVAAETQIFVWLGIVTRNGARGILAKIPESSGRLGKEMNNPANRETLSRSLGGIANITNCFLFGVACQVLSTFLSCGLVWLRLWHSRSNVLTLRQWMDVWEVNSLVFISQ